MAYRVAVRKVLFTFFGLLLGFLLSLPAWLFLSPRGGRGTLYDIKLEYLFLFAIVGLSVGGVAGRAIGILNVRRTPAAALGGLIIGGLLGLMIDELFLRSLGAKIGAILGGAVLIAAIQYALSDKPPTKPSPGDWSE